MLAMAYLNQYKLVSLRSFEKCDVFILNILFIDKIKTMQTQCYLQRPTAIPGLECRPFASCCRRIRSYRRSAMANSGGRLRRTYHQDTRLKVFQMPGCYIPHIMHRAVWYTILCSLLLPPLAPVQICQMQFENG